MVDAFEELFTQYFAKVHHFILAMSRNPDIADEITQQTFFKALKNLDSFQGRSDPGTWLCSIAKNEYFALLRRKDVPTAPDSHIFHQNSEDVADKIARQQQHMQIHRHLHALAEPYREVFMLRTFGELKYAQIAELFGRTESWARSTYYRAKLELMNRMKEEEA